jgi:hypothetical protein
MILLRYVNQMTVMIVINRVRWGEVRTPNNSTSNTQVLQRNFEVRVIKLLASARICWGSFLTAYVGVSLRTPTYSSTRYSSITHHCPIKFVLLDNVRKWGQSKITSNTKAVCYEHDKIVFSCNGNTPRLIYAKENTRIIE